MSDLLKEFKAVIENAEQHLITIPDSLSQVREKEGRWCAKEILGHLCDSAANNHPRFVLAQFSDDLVFPGYEQNDWVKVQNYKGESWQNLIQLWKSYNLHLCHIISVIPEEKLKQERDKHTLHQIAWHEVNKNESTTLEYLIRDYLGHMQHHLNQIFLLIRQRQMT
jgi:hypothetical protein